MNRLYSLNRSVEYECAFIEAQYKTNELANKKVTNWKVGSLVLLRFILNMRNLLTGYGKTFLSNPNQRRRMDENVSNISAHATHLAETINSIMIANLDYILLDSRRSHVQPDVVSNYLSFLLESFYAILFEGKRKKGIAKWLD